MAKFKNERELLFKIAEELFYMAKGLGEAAGEMIITPYGALPMRAMTRDKYYYNLKKFRKHGLVKKNIKNGNYVLTDKAKALRSRPSKKLDRQDGMSTVVLFDIPEEKKLARENFRRYLVRNGYTQIQKSAFISPYKISDELLEYIKELGIEK